MLKMVAVGTLALALFGLGAGVAQAAGKDNATKVQPGTVVGVVSDTAGKMQAGVAVKMTGEGRVMSAVSDKTGSFVLQNVVAGRYDLYVGGTKPMKVVASTEAANGLLYVVVQKQTANAEPGTLLLIGGVVCGVVVGGTPIAANNEWIGGTYVQWYDNASGYDYQKKSTATVSK